MNEKFTPNYTLTEEITSYLLRIENAKNKSISLPLNPRILTSLRQTAKLFTTHYSTMIEGNQLEPLEVKKVLKHNGHFPGRERDEQEVKGYYAALAKLEMYVEEKNSITEKIIQTLHALVISDGKVKAQPTPYRDGQNVIRDGYSGQIVYMPPEAKDVTNLMKQMIDWLNQNKHLPCPVLAAVAHYQFATIHPYFDGNGRTARLLTTLVLHLGGYDLKGLYSLEEYYAKNLPRYYEAITIGPSHNYYLGRAEADITGWISYFCEGMAFAFENVIREMERSLLQNEVDHSPILRKLDPKQRKVLELFETSEEVKTSLIAELFSFSPRTARQLCQKWVETGFFEIANPSNKNRTYSLSKKYQNIF
ncbi:MAG: Fic family protein [Candidatus Algichlamydia australiensis]|nr:Fic family protein [Chlamydiales bacterium]